MRYGWMRGACFSRQTHKCRGIHMDSAAIVCGQKPLIVPRAPSLELYVLPNGGGQLIKIAYLMELRGIEPLTSAVRLQRSPS